MNVMNFTSTKRSTGEPYLLTQPLRELQTQLRLSSRKLRKWKTNNLQTKQEGDVPNNTLDDELSNDIALAVATIVAENERLKAVGTNEGEAELFLDDVSRPSSGSGPEPDESTTRQDLREYLSLVPSKNESSCSPESVGTSVALATLTAPAPSRAAKLGSCMELMRYLGRVQNYMNHLGYHRDGEPEFKINQRLSMKMQMITAKELIRAARPIKCLHAVLLGVHFTNSLPSVERFPIYFRSHVLGKEYKHIVLGIYVQGHFGAFGISRDAGLQDKKAIYPKLSDIIFEFTKCYEDSGHELNEVKFGNIITHDQSSLEKLFSKVRTVPIHGCTNTEIEANVEKFAKQLRAKMGLPCLKSLRLESQLPAPATKLTRSKTSLSGNTSCRVRAASMGPSPGSNRSSDESIGRNGTRSRPPKSKRPNMNK